MVFFGDIVTAAPPVNICLVTNDSEADMTINRLSLALELCIGQNGSV